MRFIKLSGTIFAGALFLTSCNLLQSGEDVQSKPYPREVIQEGVVTDAGAYYGRENLDLQAIGPLLERAKNPEELEYLINSDSRINNLDINEDGYADYISVGEFNDRNDGERGLSLFSRFGPDLIQEIATIIFDRGGFDSQGARVLLAGNDQLYGDNYYYETNWRDRALPLVNYLFTDRNAAYESPYYYNNYPNYYQTYQVVETPVYQTRVREIYTDPVFVYTNNPVITQTLISSPYQGRTVANVYPLKPAKRVKEQKNNQAAPESVPVKNGVAKNDVLKPEKELKGNSNDFDKPRKNNEEKPEKREKSNNERIENPKPVKVERPDFKQSKPQRVDKPNFNPPNKPARVEVPKMKAPKPDNPGRGKGGENNPGNGGGNGGGKGNNGGGKGGGKKP